MEAPRRLMWEAARVGYPGVSSALEEYCNKIPFPFEDANLGFGQLSATKARQKCAVMPVQAGLSVGDISL